MYNPNVPSSNMGIAPISGQPVQPLGPTPMVLPSPMSPPMMGGMSPPPPMAPLPPPSPITEGLGGFGGSRSGRAGFSDRMQKLTSSAMPRSMPMSQPVQGMNMGGSVSSQGLSMYQPPMNGGMHRMPDGSMMSNNDPSMGGMQRPMMQRPMGMMNGGGVPRDVNPVGMALGGFIGNPTTRDYSNDDPFGDDMFGSGNIFTETFPGASTINFGIGSDDSGGGDDSYKDVSDLTSNSSSDDSGSAIALSIAAEEAADRQLAQNLAAQSVSTFDDPDEYLGDMYPAVSTSPSDGNAENSAQIADEIAKIARESEVAKIIGIANAQMYPDENDGLLDSAIAPNPISLARPVTSDTFPVIDAQPSASIAAIGGGGGDNKSAAANNVLSLIDSREQDRKDRLLGGTDFSDPAEGFYPELGVNPIGLGLPPSSPLVSGPAINLSNIISGVPVEDSDMGNAMAVAQAVDSGTDSPDAERDLINALGSDASSINFSKNSLNEAIEAAYGDPALINPALGLGPQEVNNRMNVNEAMAYYGDNYTGGDTPYSDPNAGYNPKFDPVVALEELGPEQYAVGDPINETTQDILSNLAAIGEPLTSRDVAALNNPNMGITGKSRPLQTEDVASTASVSSQSDNTGLVNVSPNYVDENGYFAERDRSTAPKADEQNAAAEIALFGPPSKAAGAFQSLMKALSYGVIDLKKINDKQRERGLKAYRNTGKLAYDEKGRAIGVKDPDGKTILLGPQPQDKDDTGSDSDGCPPGFRKVNGVCQPIDGVSANPADAISDSISSATLPNTLRPVVTNVVNEEDEVTLPVEPYGLKVGGPNYFANGGAVSEGMGSAIDNFLSSMSR